MVDNNYSDALLSEPVPADDVVQSTSLLTWQILVGRVPDRYEHRDHVVVRHVEKPSYPFRVEADHGQGGQPHSMGGKHEGHCRQAGATHGMLDPA